MDALVSSRLDDDSIGRYLEDIPIHDPGVDVVRLAWRHRDPTSLAADPLALTVARLGSGPARRWATFSIERIERRRLRGIPWTAFPVVAPPRLKLEDETKATVYALPGSGPPSCVPMPYKARLANALAMASRVVMDDGPDTRGKPGHPSEWLMPRLTQAAVSLLCKDLAPQLTAMGLETAEGHVGWHDPREIAAATKGSQGLIRFRFSHQANAEAILLPALRHVAAYLDDTVLREDRRSVPGYHQPWLWEQPCPTDECKVALSVGDIRSMGGVLATQMLFRLRRMGRSPHPAAPANLAESFAGLFDGRSQGSLHWRGSGMHPYATEMTGVVHDVARTLVWFGFVRSDGTALVLTECGERFLDCLHPDMEDPDVLCRWQVPAVANEDIDARVDAWIMRVFSKCKTRINALH